MKKPWLLISRHNDISFRFAIIYPNHIKICGTINGKNFKCKQKGQEWKGEMNIKMRT